MSKLSGRQIADAQLTGWVQLAGGLQTRIQTGDFATGLRVVTAIGAAAEELNHHPDVNLRYPHVDLRLLSHDEGGLTGRDVRLARRITDIANREGVTLDGSRLGRVELGLDSPDYRQLRPFWAAVLDLSDSAEPDDNDLEDPAGALPSIWFQQSGADEPRQHWHPDVWVDPSQVQPRIEAAIAAGGSLVSEERAPSFWVLADPEGNQICLCTWQEREG